MARIQWIDVLIAPLTLGERARGRRRLGLLGLYGLILGVGGVLVGREAVLWRLPAVRSIDLPQPGPRALADADNAMVLYQAAVQRIVRDDVLFRSLPKGVGLTWDWAAVDPRLHPWVEANRPGAGPLAPGDRPLGCLPGRSEPGFWPGGLPGTGGWGLRWAW